MIKIPSLETVGTDPKLVTLNEFVRDFVKLIDQKFKHIDICPTKKAKTPFCKHKKGCVHNLIIHSMNGFFKSFSIQLLINLFYFLLRFMKKKVQFNKIFLEVFKKNTLSIGLFLGFQNITLRAVTCSLRFWFWKNSVFTDLTAGFLAGMVSYPFASRNAMLVISYFFFSRVIESFSNILEEKNLLQKS